MSGVKKLYSIDLTKEIWDLPNKMPGLGDAGTVLKTLAKLIKPAVFWIDMDIERRGPGYIVGVEEGGNARERSLTISSKYIASGLRECYKFTLAAATIGSELPEHSRLCQAQGKLWEATVADCLGSYAVEELIKKFQNYLVQTNSHIKIFPTPRYSPGYGDWSLQVQKQIIDILDASSEIKVNSHYMLEPVKSVTALIGWSHKIQQETYPEIPQKEMLCRGEKNCQDCKTSICRERRERVK